MFFQGLCKRRTKLRGSTDHNWRTDSIFHFFKFPSHFSQMVSCWKGDKSNLSKNQYKTKLYSHQTSSVLNEYIKYHTVFCILDLYTVYRGVLPPKLSSYALMYEIYIIYTYILYIYIYIYIYISYIIYHVIMKTMCPPDYHHEGFMATHARIWVATKPL